MTEDPSVSSQGGEQPRQTLYEELLEDDAQTEQLLTSGRSRLSISQEGQPILTREMTDAEAQSFLGTHDRDGKPTAATPGDASAPDEPPESDSVYLTDEEARRFIGGGPLASGQQTKASMTAQSPIGTPPGGAGTAYNTPATSPLGGGPTPGIGNLGTTAPSNQDQDLMNTLRLRFKRQKQAAQAARRAQQAPAAPTNQYVCVGGEWIKVAAAPKQMSNDSSYVIYPKEERVNMSADAQQQLKETFLKKKSYCALREITLDADGIDGKTIDANSLKDTLRLSKVMENIRKLFRVYDVYNVSHILLFSPNDPAKIASSKDIFTHFLNLTTDQVARSNRWYNTLADNPWTRQNMSLQTEFLSIHLDPTILDTIKVTYDRYPIECQGGPLLFHLASTHLVNRSKHLGDTLLARMRNIRISELPGEDVLKALSYVRVVLPYLSEYNNRPDDTVATVLSIFQTTTHAAFNAVLKNMETNRVLKQAERESQGRAALSRADKIAEEDRELETVLTTISHLATTTFKLDWPGIKSSQTSAFPAQQSGSQDRPDPSGGGTKDRTCFNCGRAGCSVATCPRPKNKALITANKKKFWDANKNRKKKQGGAARTSNRPQKFRLPEASENNRRVIDGKPHTFNTTRKRWVPDQANTATPASADEPTVATTTSTLTTATAPPVPTTVTQANLRRQFETLKANMAAMASSIT